MKKLLKKLFGRHKEIELTDAEKIFIGVCKLRYRYGNNLSWIDTLEPFFEKIYGWSSADFPKDFKKTLKRKLFVTYMKIREPQNESNSDLMDLIDIASQKRFEFDPDDSEERVIAMLGSMIQGNLVLDEHGRHRYSFCDVEESCKWVLKFKRVKS